MPASVPASTPASVPAARFRTALAVVAMAAFTCTTTSACVPRGGTGAAAAGPSASQASPPDGPDGGPAGGPAPGQDGGGSGVSAPPSGDTPVDPGPTGTARQWGPTTTRPPPAPAIGAACAPPRDASPGGGAHGPAELDGLLAALRGSGGPLGLSVWVDGVGEVLAEQPDRPLVPASNQKLLVAMATFELIPADERLATTVVATGPVAGGIVAGDLVLTGGGDPTLTRSGTDSLEALVAQLGQGGITGVAGRLVIDTERFDHSHDAPGWPDSGAWAMSTGPVSALAVDRNRGNGDPAFMADPDRSNGDTFRAMLAAAGIDVPGPTVVEPGSPGIEVARVESAPVPSLIAEMLTRSDNAIAEMLIKELGYRTTGRGTEAAGLAAAMAAGNARCMGLDGNNADGSGLSQNDSRSPRAWRRLLQVASERPWGPAFEASLPVAGQSGTLAARLQGPSTAGRVRAKTGSTRHGVALSGYLLAASGRRVIFSVVVNEPYTTTGEAIDRFVTGLAELL